MTSGCWCWMWLWFLQELLKSKEGLYVLCRSQPVYILPVAPHACHITDTHTHLFFLAAISNIHSPIPFNWNKSTGSHGWITGSIKNMPVKKCQDPCSKGTVVLYQLFGLIDCLTDCVNGSKAGGLGVTLYNIPYGSRWAAKWVMFFMPPAPSHSNPLDSRP